MRCAWIACRLLLAFGPPSGCRRQPGTNSLPLTRGKLIFRARQQGNVSGRVAMPFKLILLRNAIFAIFVVSTLAAIIGGAFLSRR